MMRYQRVSPDYIPFSNGKKPNSRTPSTCKEAVCENAKTITTNGFDSSFDGTKASFDGTKGFRFRSPSRTTPENSTATANGVATSSSPLSETNNSHNQRFDISPNRGDVLLQWGQKKRARLSRTDIHRAFNDDLSSSSSSIHGRQPISKVQRRGSGLMEKVSTPPLPPPPPVPSSNGSYSSRASNLRCKETSGFTPNRNIEDRSGLANGSPSRISGNNGSNTSKTRAISRSTITGTAKGSPSSSSSGSRKDEKLNGSLTRSAAAAATTTTTTPHHHHNHNHGDSSSGGGIGVGGRQENHHNNNNTSGVGGEKGNNNNINNGVEVLGWPKIHIALSRKEKEEDFLAMKGTKLPQRPKKRAKNVERTLQYCFPGMWLSDLSKSRYEVREKKCAKKQQKRRGLKGMESMDTDSD